MTFQHKITNRSRLRWITSPIEFAKHFHVLGYDKNKDKVAELNRLVDKTDEANINDLDKVVLNKKLKVKFK